MTTKQANAKMGKKRKKEADAGSSKAKVKKDGEMAACDPALALLPPEVLNRRVKAKNAAAELTSDVCIKIHFDKEIKKAKGKVWPALKAALTQGLAKRADIVAFSWLSDSCVLLRLRLTGEEDVASGETIILGPSATEASLAAEFRQLWGPDLCQLRRFEDGSVKESIQLRNPWGASRKVVAIVAHLAEQQGGRTVPLLIPDDVVTHDILEGQQLTEVRSALATLTTMLSDLADSSLPLRRARGLGAVIRGSETTGSFAVPAQIGKAVVKENQGFFMLKSNASISPSLCQAIPVSLDITHRKNLFPETFKLLRTAYLISVMKTLNAKHVVAKMKQEKLYVVYRKFVFVLDVDSPDTLIDLSKGDESSLQNFLQSVGLRFGASWRGAAHTLRQWLAAKMMEASVSGVLIDLLLANVFLHPAHGLPAPKTAESAVVRVLDLLSFHDFTKDILLIDEEKDLSKEGGAVEKAKLIMLNRRDELPAMVMLTPFDGVASLSSFTKHLHSTNLQRLINLARQALHVISVSGQGPNWLAFKENCLSECDLASFDVIIHLKPLSMAKRRTKVDSSEQKSKLKSLPVVDFDPVQVFLEELQVAYGSIARFYYGHSSAVVGVKLEDAALAEKKIDNIKKSQGHMMTEDKMLKPNLEAMLADFSLLGNGLVKSVDVNIDL